MLHDDSVNNVTYHDIIHFLQKAHCYIVANLFQVRMQAGLNAGGRGSYYN